MLSSKQYILMLSTADWDNPFWTNKQHVALELSLQGHKVLYVDSLGLRPPSINKSDFTRIFRRLLKGLRFPRRINENLWVWSPIVIPFQKYRAVEYSTDGCCLSFRIYLHICWVLESQCCGHITR